MDNRFDPDQVVLSRAGSALEESEALLAQPIGRLSEMLHARGRRNHPSEIEKLIGAAITEALTERNIVVDAVMHGVFDEKAKLAAGVTTLNDIWNIIPYENLIVTATLSPEEIRTVMEEVCRSHEPRSLLGITLGIEGGGADCRVNSMTFPDGRSLERDQKYTLAFNSFDARSAGHRFMKLRALLERPEAKCVLHPVQTRDAVIEYFRRHKVIGRIGAIRPMNVDRLISVSS
jgi:2',3'-cyclic-nucleotide 2'-phosphodiesterase (5'-nucleotidase family)